MAKLLTKSTYASSMPDWVKAAFFDSDSEKECLVAHEYSQSKAAQKFRNMDNLQLVGFYEHSLKCKCNFEEALEVLARSPFKGYLKKYMVPQPGDHLAQFYPRQAVYSAIKSSQLNQVLDQALPSTTSTQQEPSATNQSSSSSATTESSVPERDILGLMESTVQFIGPFHVSLNGREEIITIYHPFFSAIFSFLFKGKVLAGKPKPRRDSTLLEIIYGGWTLIRSTVKSVFSHCKDIQYQVLLNLLHNYCLWF